MFTKSRKLVRMSSSREFVASFKLIRSVALSLLLLLSCAISRCKFVAILVRLRIWLEIASKDCGARNNADELLVILDKEVSVSLGVGVFCRASIIDDGGVFSPNIAFGGGLDVGRRTGVSLATSFALGVGVPVRVGLFSGDLFSKSKPGVRGILSSERSKEEVPSRKLFRSLILL